MEITNATVSRIALWVLLISCLLLAGCPQYNVYKSRLNGEAIKAEAEGSKQALLSQAEAEKGAAAARAEAAKSRSDGWADAAKEGCGKAGLGGDRECVLRMLAYNANFAVAREAHEGTSLVMGLSGADISVPAAPPTTTKPSE